MRRYCFDIDGTICHTPLDNSGKPDYLNAIPNMVVRDQINDLYYKGNYIIFQTARGKSSGTDWTKITENQLKKWGFKYHELFKMFCKPTADIFVDDKGINIEDWLKSIPIKRGILAGAFDLIHPGYIKMFKEAKLNCTYLTVALHEDPSVARPQKLKPVQSVDERKEILLAIKYIDEVIVYQTEETFLSYLNDYDIRFLGTDYIDGSYTGKDLSIEIVWLSRNHNYSSTKLKTDIYHTINGKVYGEYD